jgi:glycine/D-amino acid oxidase-like deaminating enzyme
VGPIEAIPGLYMVTGFSGNDFQLAPTIGEGMAQMLHEQPVSAFDTEFFSAGRF